MKRLLAVLYCVLAISSQFPAAKGTTPSKRTAVSPDSTSVPPPQCECDGEKMTIKGDFVKSSDIQPSKCPSNRLAEINVFVVGVFYVDSDLNLDGCRELNIFADKWMIPQPTTFNLNGIDGEEQPKPNCSGTPGKPGNPGSNAGNFFGLSNEVENGDMLTVNLNAGNGAKGQDGTGNEDVEPPFTGGKHTEFGMLDDKVPNPNTYCENFLKSQGHDAERVYSPNEDDTVEQRFKIHPKRCCGPTGLGGSGGMGGKAGNYTFIQTSNVKSNLPTFNSSNGTPGEKGEDASPCKSKALGVKATMDFNLLDRMPAYQLNSSYSVENRVDDDRCPDKFMRSNEHASEPDPGKPQEIVPAIIEYKTFLRDCMKNAPQPETVRQSYAAIDSNPSIVGAYVIADFARELNALHGQYNELGQYVDFLPFYDNLLRGIRIYAIASAEQRYVPGHERQLLVRLCSSIWNSTKNMRGGQKSDLIVDIENLFGIILY